MDYLQTTGDRLHDLELDRILARLRTLEAASSSVSTITPATVQSAITSTVAGVRSITPGSGTQMSNDISLASVGSIALSQAANTIAFTVPVLVAGTNITLTPAGNNITIAASGGGSSIPANVLTISPVSWVVPAALTEYDNNTAYRSQHDLTNAMSARLCILLPSASLLLSPPSFAAQYSIDNGSTWHYLDGSSGPNVTYGTGFTTLVSSWITLAVHADVLMRVVASGGDGSTSVSLGTVYVQAK